MLPERVIAHEELSRGRCLSEAETLVMQAVGALNMGGKKKAAKAMRRVLRLLARQSVLVTEHDVTLPGLRQPSMSD